MSRRYQYSSVVLWFAALSCIAVSVSVILYQYLQLRASNELVEHSFQVLSETEQLSNSLKVLSGEPLALRAAQEAESLVNLEHVRALTQNDPSQQKKLDTLKTLLWGSQISATAATLADDRKISTAVELGESLRSEEQRLLVEQRLRRDETIRTLTALVMLLAFSALVMFMFGVSGFERARRAEANHKREFLDTNQRLQHTVTELSRSTEEMRALNQLGATIHMCETLEELTGALHHFLIDRYPAINFSIAQFTEDRDMLVADPTWSASDAAESTFTLEQCLALRGGRPAAVSPQTALRCGHYEKDALFHRCIPLSAQGGSIGVMSYSYDEGQIVSEGVVDLACESFTLAFSNIQLREVLRNQAIRDPLTGLFNRRYLEASLSREFVLNERSGGGFGVLMIDVDHFKRFNDRFGHEIGDSVLRHVAQKLAASSRASDAVCRFGGEEFTMLLPGTTGTELNRRAEQIRESIQSLEPIPGSELRVTISIGAASFPEDGTTPETLLESADTFLYRAKQTGRNRVSSSLDQMSDLAHSHGTA